MAHRPAALGQIPAARIRRWPGHRAARHPAPPRRRPGLHRRQARQLRKPAAPLTFSKYPPAARQISHPRLSRDILAPSRLRDSPPRRPPYTPLGYVGCVDMTSVQLAIGGMTCASCASRVEKQLTKLPGVTASVNLATQIATLTVPAATDPAALVAAVRQAGYTATPPAEVLQDRSAGVQDRSAAVQDHSAGNPGAAVARDPSVPGVSGSSAAPGSSARGLRTAFPPRLLVCLVLAVPVVALAMVPALQFRGWAWASLVLASPVVLWGAWPLYRAAIANARHGAATMDTLVSLGVAAAYLWSLYALIVGHGSTYLDV